MVIIKEPDQLKKLLATKGDEVSLIICGDAESPAKAVYDTAISELQEPWRKTFLVSPEVIETAGALTIPNGSFMMLRSGATIGEGSLTQLLRTDGVPSARLVRDVVDRAEGLS